MKYISLPLSNARKVTSMYKNCIFLTSLSSSLLQKMSVTLDTFARSDSELWIDSLPRLLYNLIMTYNDTVTCTSVIANVSINFTYDCWEMLCTVKAGFQERRSRSRSRNQKRRTLRSGENSILIPLTTPTLTIKWKIGCRSHKLKWKN